MRVSRIGWESAIRSRDSAALEFVIDATQALGSLVSVDGLVSTVSSHSTFVETVR
jgi:hypothetical protein